MPPPTEKLGQKAAKAMCSAVKAWEAQHMYIDKKPDEQPKKGKLSAVQEIPVPKAAISATHAAAQKEVKRGYHGTRR